MTKKHCKECALNRDREGMEKIVALRWAWGQNNLPRHSLVATGNLGSSVISIGSLLEQPDKDNEVPAA